jgi:hypothetical protein
MLKKSLITIAMAISLSTLSLHAIEVKSALSEDANTIIDNVTGHLDVELSDISKLKLFDTIFKDYAEDGGWNLKPINYTTALADSKVSGKTSESPTQFVDYVFSYEDRTVFITLINYSKQKQILATVREVLPTSTAKLLVNYEEDNKNEKVENIYDAENYSLFQDKGQVSYTSYHVNGSNSTVVYAYANLISY